MKRVFLRDWMSNRFNAQRNGYLCCYSRAVDSSRSGIIPRDLYAASLARKWMAAGALCRDQEGRVLMVDPVYRDTWDVPGGVVEADESPHAACRREVAEEIGLDRPLGRVLAVDWVPSKPDYPEGVVVIYDGGVLTAAERAGIRVPEEELDGFAFVPPGEVAERVEPIVGRRIHACLSALQTGKVAALDNGHPAS
jgi:8-oxo-dGTP diphosphatase